MKALVYTQPLTIEYTDVPTPKPQADELLLAVQSVGICGSDLHAYQGHDSRRQAPLILGHEVCGIAQNTHLKGQRVVVNPLVTCGQCDSCLSDNTHLCPSREIIGMKKSGAFAQYLCIDQQNALPIPDSVSNAQAAMTEPAATAYHAIKTARRLTNRPFSEQKILIIGGGAIGLLSAFLLTHYGASQLSLIQRNPLKRAQLQTFMPCQVTEPDNRSVVKEDFFDLIIDAVGSQASRTLASFAVRPGGSFIHVGLSDANHGLDIRKFTLQEIAFSGVYCYSFLDFKRTLECITQGAFGDLSWAQSRSMSEGAKAFQDLYERKTSAAKIILNC